MSNTSKLFFPIKMASTVILTITILVLLESNHLRPTGDDYCFGVVSADGVLGGCIRWWNNWSSFLFPIFIQNFLVGLPLLHMPWEVASAIPFISTGLGIGIAVIYLTPTHFRNLPNLFLMALLAFSWWAFLWINVLINTRVDSNIQLAFGLTHWQTLNGAYVIPILISLCIWSKIWSHSSIINVKNLLLTVFFGLWCGTLVITLSLALIIICGTIPIASWIFKLKVSRQRNILWWTLFFSISIGVIVSFILSPGLHVRMIESDKSFDITWDLIEYLRFIVIPDSLSLWIDIYFGWSSLFILLLTFSFFSLVKLIGKCNDSLNDVLLKCEWFFDAGLLMAGFSLLQVFIVSVSEYFAYPAYWHYASPLVTVFLSVYFFGVSAGTATTLFNKNFIFYFVLPCLFLMIALGVVANFTMVHSMKERKLRWEIGPAPLSILGFGDIENNDYIGVCWERLDNFKNHTSKRGN